MSGCLTTPGSNVTLPQIELRGHGIVFGESAVVAENGALIMSFAVRLDGTASCWPGETLRLVKGCRAEHSIERCGTIRLSKPEVFRHEGRTLIADPLEAVAQSVDSQLSEATDSDLRRAQLVEDEYNRAAAAIGSALGTTIEHVTVHQVSTTTWTYGQNCLMLCASREPDSDQEWAAWRRSLDPAYDHVTTIEKPRSFAQALARLAAEQLGPISGADTLTHIPSHFQTAHSTLKVFHGPVVYVDDPDSYVSGDLGSFEKILRSVFFKRSKYRDQREYRFVIWSEHEPETPTIDLSASPRLLETLGESEVLRLPQAIAAGAKAAEKRQRELQRLSCLLDQSVLERDSEPSAAVASQAKEFLEELVSEFPDPVSELAWHEDILVISLNTGLNCVARFAIGPQGTAHLHVGSFDPLGWRFDVSCIEGSLLVSLVVDLLRPAVALGNGDGENTQSLSSLSEHLSRYAMIDCLSAHFADDAFRVRLAGLGAKALAVLDIEVGSRVTG